ncbi:MAG: hypothetical protein WDN28_15090 [Chthoniobacter sp.]
MSRSLPFTASPLPHTWTDAPDFPRAAPSPASHLHPFDRRRAGHHRSHHRRTTQGRPDVRSHESRHVWDLSTHNWDGSTDAWINGNNAIFGSPGEAVELNGAITVGDNHFQLRAVMTSWTRTTMAPWLWPARARSPSTNAADTATISAAVTTGDITKAGLGTIELSGANKLSSGAVTVNAGVLKSGVQYRARRHHGRHERDQRRLARPHQWRHRDGEKRSASMAPAQTSPAASRPRPAPRRPGLGRSVSIPADRASGPEMAEP